VYRPELARLLWPIFVHSVLSLAKGFYIHEGPAFFEKHHKRFEREHAAELAELKSITTPEHMDAQIAKIFLDNKYRLTITVMAFNVLLQFLEAKEKDGGSVIVTLIQQHLQLVPVDRAHSGHERSLAAMLARPGEEYDHPAEDEGIPGHNPGSANTDPNAPRVLAKLALGPVALDPDTMEDIQSALQKEDAVKPPLAGQTSLSAEFAQMIKKEPNDDAPTRDQVGLPATMSRDIAMEIQKVREHRDRFKIDPRTSGIAPGVSVVMYTFHNTFDK
jgi:transcription initiation factor TFIID subunit 5